MSVRYGLVFLALAAASIAVAEPSIQRIEPPGVGQGQEIEIRITGTQLEEPRELFFEDSRISVAKLESDGSAAVKATVRVPADCPLGGYRVRLRTADGLSDLRMFHVTKAAQAREQEPNNEPAQALAIDLAKLGSGGETIVWGTVGGEDVDTLKVHLPKGGRIDAVVDAVRLEQQPVDLYLELVDAEGFVVGDCDDHPLLCQDPALSVTVAEEGDYFLRVRETAFAGAAQPYQLHVGRFPVAHVAWPPGGRTGEAVDVEWVGDPAGPFRQKVTIPPPGLDGLARVHPVRDGVISPIAVPLRSTSVPVTVCAEPSGEPEQAGSAAAPAAIAGRMDSSDDVDWIRVTAAKGTKWKITGWARRLGTPVDLVIAAHRDNDKHDRITSNDDSNGPDSQIQVTVPDEGSFLLRVNDFQRLGGPEYVYWIDVEPLVAGATVSVPPAITRTQQRLVVGVPRGNRAALFLNASRVDCPEPLKLEFTGLPAGVTALTGPFTEPAPGGLVVFEAAADATPAVSLAEIKLTRGEGPQAAVVGGLRQGTDTVIGDPNRTTWRTVYGDRMAVAVLDEAPVSIELDQPQVPIVRRGVMDLRVRVKRADGFAGKLRLELPFKPPGIGALNIDVKDGESEVVFPISASAEAAIREWPIAVAATVLPPGEDDKKRSAYRTVKGIWISTNPITLSVAEQIVDLVAEKAVAEQGSEFKMVFKLPEPAALEAPAKVTLMGLPVKVEATPVELSPKAEKLEIPLKVGADAPAGKHDNIFCRIEVPLKGTIVVHQSAPTSIRIDKPLPGGVAVAAPSERSK